MKLYEILFLAVMACGCITVKQKPTGAIIHTGGTGQTVFFKLSGVGIAIDTCYKIDTSMKFIRVSSMGDVFMLCNTINEQH